MGRPRASPCASGTWRNDEMAPSDVCETAERGSYAVKHLVGASIQAASPVVPIGDVVVGLRRCAPGEPLRHDPDQRRKGPQQNGLA